ncbi:ribosome-binding protein 1b [Aplochiton taeniatus]
MDVSDPQTLGFMVFGGFMVVSAIGIALVSTLSMKETSYEEALANQRRQQGSKATASSALSRSERKKREKALERKGKAKKKEEPNGKLPEPAGNVVEPISDPEPEVEPEPEPATDPEPQSDPEPEPQPEPVVQAAPEPVVVASAPPPVAMETPPAPSPKEKKKKKGPKVEPAPIVEAVAKEVPVMAVPPVVEVAPVTSEPPPSLTEEPPKADPPKAEPPKADAPSKKKKKAKTEAGVSAEAAVVGADAPLLPTTVSTMGFSHAQGLPLIQVLNAPQKGDPVSALRKQLEEKEKQLSSEQEVASAAKSRLKELTKELNEEKSRLASVESGLKAEVVARSEELTALQARMQTSYQDHLTQSQQLNTKIASLQEQLENGPNAQLARLQQENSILRDALNQATSQAESRQNAELAKLRQDCVRLSRELADRSEAGQADKEHRRTLEAKVAAAEQQLALVQASQSESERVLQQRLEEAKETSLTLQSQQDTITQLQQSMVSMETELKERCTELESLRAQKEVVKEEEEEEVDSVSVGSEELQSLLQEKEVQVAALEEELQQLRDQMEQSKNSSAGSGSEMEAEQPFESLEKDSQMLSLEEELQQLREEMEQVKNKSNDLREKNWSAMEALSAAEKMNQEKLTEAHNERCAAEAAMASFQLETQKSLQLLFPGISLNTEQSNWLEVFTQDAQEMAPSQTVQEEDSHTAESVLQSKLQEAEESQRTLQAECEQYRTVLGETEGMLKTLQKSVEEEELVWKAKIAEAEEQRQKALDQLKEQEQSVPVKSESEETNQLKEQVMLLEAQLEKQVETIGFSQSHAQEVSQLRAQLSDTQSQLEIAHAQAQKLPTVQAQLEDTTTKLQTEEEMRLQLASDFEQAQQCVTDLQTQMDQMKAAEECSSAELKARLEKEKRLTKDLGQAATKLQQLLKATQEHLAQEKDNVQTLQSQLMEKEEQEQPKEGTSV